MIIKHGNMGKSESDFCMFPTKNEISKEQELTISPLQFPIFGELEPYVPIHCGCFKNKN